MLASTTTAAKAPMSFVKIEIRRMCPIVGEIVSDRKHSGDRFPGRQPLSSPSIDPTRRLLSVQTLPTEASSRGAPELSQ